MSTDLAPKRVRFAMTGIERRVFEQRPDIGAQLTERSGMPVVLVRAESREKFTAWCSSGPVRFEIGLVRTKFGAILRWTIIHYVSLDFGVAVALYLGVETDANRQAQDSLDGLSELPVYIFDSSGDNPHLLALPLSEENRIEARNLYQEAVNYQATLTQVDKHQAQRMAIQQSWQGQWVDAVEPTYFAAGAPLLLEVMEETQRPEEHFSAIRRKIGGSLEQITALANRSFRLVGLARAGQLTAWGISTDRDQHLDFPRELLNIAAVVPLRDDPRPEWWPELLELPPDKVPDSLRVKLVPPPVAHEPITQEWLISADQARLRVVFAGSDAPTDEARQREIVEERLVSGNFMWQALKADKRVPTHPKGWLVVRGSGGGVGNELIIELLRPERVSVLDALRELEDSEWKQGRRLSVRLTCAILTAARGIERLAGSVQTADQIGFAAQLAALSGSQFQSESLPVRPELPAPLNRKLIDEQAREVGTPRLYRSVDVARWVLARARACWSEPSLLALTNRREQQIFVEANTAAIDILLRSEPVVTVSGVTLPVPLRAAPLAWLTASVLRGIDSEALLALTDDGNLPRRKATNLTLSEDQRSVLRGIASSLLRLADEQAVYTPVGYFRVRIPSDLHPLRAIGLSALRAVADADGMWVRLEGTDDQGVCRWTPAGLNDPFFSEGFALALHACLAALWHDLRVSTEAVRPENESSGLFLGRVEVEAQPNSAAKSPGQSRTRHNTAVRVLPRLLISGQVAWGTLSEQRIARQIYSRVGHRRRLHDPAWRRRPTAVAEAAIWGVVLPDGYTWVRRLDQPHLASDAPATPIRVTARGLVSLLAVVQDTDTQTDETK